MLICLDTFWTNPQFPLKITELNKGCEPIPNQAPNILVSLMQKPDKRNRRLTRKLYIGFNIYKASKLSNIPIFCNMVVYSVSLFS